jgi:hypothetical protein
MTEGLLQLFSSARPFAYITVNTYTSCVQPANLIASPSLQVFDPSTEYLYEPKPPLSYTTAPSMTT